MNRIDGLLADPKLITRDGSKLALTAPLPTEAVTLVALFGPPLFGFSALGGLLNPLRGLGDALGGSNVKSQNNLKQLGLAIHAYHDANGKFPADITDKDGKPLLSWRVAILPFIEQQALYEQFHLDEPWDSPHNLELAKTLVPTYACPSSPTEPGMTNYRVFVGDGAAFDLAKPAGIQEFRDGTSNTLMVVEAGEAVPWTKPEDLPFDPEKPLPKLGGHFPGGFNAALMDGSVRFLKTTINPMVLKALITRNGGEVVSRDQF